MAKGKRQKDEISSYRDLNIWKKSVNIAKIFYKQSQSLSMNYISDDIIEQFKREINEIERMLNSLIKKLKND